MIRTTLATSLLALVTSQAVAQHSLVFVPEASIFAASSTSVRSTASIGTSSVRTVVWFRMRSVSLRIKRSASAYQAGS